jgi:murein DD-endopeptidase MepM/ murein hydrolase activator NlpD
MSKMGHNILLVLCIVFPILLVVLVVVYFVATGPDDLSLYPAADTSPYRLPWPEGKTYLCVQSNRAIVSHRKWDRYSYDFAMPVGSDICAARAGEVTKVVIQYDRHGYSAPNNMVIVRHEDGTYGNYYHIKKDGSYVKVGDKVAQGQVIAASGHVGKSMLPHLHFCVSDPANKGTLRMSFSNAGKDAGVPRMFKCYTPLPKKD